MSEQETRRTVPQPPPRLEADEISKLAADIVEGRVYITNTADGLRDAFALVLMFLDLDPIVEQVGAVYERMEKAGPLAINGKPCFTSLRFLHADDLPLLNTTMERWQEARNNLGVG